MGAAGRGAPLPSRRRDSPRGRGLTAAARWNPAPSPPHLGFPRKPPPLRGRCTVSPAVRLGARGPAAGVPFSIPEWNAPPEEPRHRGAAAGAVPVAQLGCPPQPSGHLFPVWRPRLGLKGARGKTEMEGEALLPRACRQRLAHWPPGPKISRTSAGSPEDQADNNKPSLYWFLNSRLRVGGRENGARTPRGAGHRAEAVRAPGNDQ